MSLERETKAKWHDKQADHAEELLKISSLSKERIEGLQSDLIYHRRIAHHLRQPVSGNPDSKMKSFVGVSRFYFNG